MQVWMVWRVYWLHQRLNFTSSLYIAGPEPFRALQEDLECWVTNIGVQCWVLSTCKLNQKLNQKINQKLNKKDKQLNQNNIFSTINHRQPLILVHPRFFSGTKCPTSSARRWIKLWKRWICAAYWIIATCVLVTFLSSYTKRTSCHKLSYNMIMT